VIRLDTTETSPPDNARNVVDELVRHGFRREDNVVPH